MKQPRLFPFIGGLAAAALVWSVAPAGADIVKCQSSIEKNGDKARAAIWKAFAKCKDGYRKAVEAGEPLSVKAGPACELALVKALDLSPGSKSSLAKAKAALDKLTDPAKLTCTDTDLIRLGHLPTAQFGDHWSRWVCLAALKAAYESQVSWVGSTANVFQELETNSCPSCASLGRPPCLRSSCALLAGDGASPLAASEAETRVLNASTPLWVPISGELISDGCRWPGLTDGEVATVGGPSIGTNPTSVLGNTVCTLSIRSEGFTNCSGAAAMPNVSYVSCQDSKTDGGDSDECPGFLGGSPYCSGNPPNASTSAACFVMTTSSGVAGHNFALATTQLRVVAGGQEGADGVPCTADDTAPPTAPSVLPLTTGSATARIMDAGNTDGNHVTQGPVSGSPGPGCTSLEQGTLTGLTLVGAFPAADTSGSPLGDTVTATRLQCQ